MKLALQLLLDGLLFTRSETRFNFFIDKGLIMSRSSFVLLFMVGSLGSAISASAQPKTTIPSRPQQNSPVYYSTFAPQLRKSAIIPQVGKVQIYTGKRHWGMVSDKTLQGPTKAFISADLSGVQRGVQVTDVKIVGQNKGTLQLHSASLPIGTRSAYQQAGTRGQAESMPARTTATGVFDAFQLDKFNSIKIKVKAGGKWYDIGSLLPSVL